MTTTTAQLERFDGVAVKTPPLFTRPDCDIERRDFRAFLRSLPRASVDLILTDPPYTISRKTGFANVVHGEKRFAVSMDFGDWDHKQINLSVFAREAYAALKKGGTAIVWYDIWKLGQVADAMSEAGFRMLRLIVWNKTNPVPLNSKALYLTGAREMAVLGVRGSRPTFHGEYDSGDYEFPIPRHGGKRIHPTQKPLALFKELVCKHSNSGDMVVDPFLGSGTTAVAALQNERAFAGCDIDPAYVKAAKARVRDL